MDYIDPGLALIISAVFFVVWIVMVVTDYS